jgi:hypothetical protein
MKKQQQQKIALLFLLADQKSDCGTFFMVSAISEATLTTS